MQSSKEQFQEQLVDRVKEVEAVPQLEYAYYRFNLNLQRYYSLALLKSAYSIISLGLALILNIPCFENYFLITEFTWVIFAVYLKTFYDTTPKMMTFSMVSAFVFLLFLFCLLSYLLISEDKLWGDGWMIELLWIIHLIFYCCLLQPLIKMVVTWFKYRKWSCLVINNKKYQLKEFVTVSLQSIPHKSSKDLKLNSQTSIRSFSHLKEKSLKANEKSTLNYSSMCNIK